MISVELADALRTAGLVWQPSPGDHFALPDRGLDAETFVLSDMTIQVHQVPAGRVIGFNGTTEWALDDVDQSEATWLPREDQLRELLGVTFEGLDRLADGYRVRTTRGGPDGFTAPEAAQAYALALLDLIRRASA